MTLINIKKSMWLSFAIVFFQGIGLCNTVLIAASEAEQSQQEFDPPNLTNRQLPIPFNPPRASTMSLDGRIVVGTTFRSGGGEIRHWTVKVFRPESLTYTAEGQPEFLNTFSEGKIWIGRYGEASLAFCFDDPVHPYRMVGAATPMGDGGEESYVAIYEPWVYSARHEDSDPHGESAPREAQRMRRARMTITVRNPFTVNAEVESVHMTEYQFLTTESGEPVYGIEPTLTEDGRFFILHDNLNRNTRENEDLMYTYNPSPCALHGWKKPKRLEELHLDRDPRLSKYPLSWKPLKASSGVLLDGAKHPLEAAYPWIDPSGRNILYTAIHFIKPNGSRNGRREGLSYIGADTGWTAIHLDGGINESRNTVVKKFYTSPMWMFERDRFSSITLPIGSENNQNYLPVSKMHDVLPIFGMDTASYNEIDINQLNGRNKIILLPMNEFIPEGVRMDRSPDTYDVTRSPDLSGNFFTGVLYGDALITETNKETQSSSRSLHEIHGRGKALRVSGRGLMKLSLDESSVYLNQTLDGLTVEMLVKPSKSHLEQCTERTLRYLVIHESFIRILLVNNEEVVLMINIGGHWVSSAKFNTALGEWTHLAWSIDGVEGIIRSYRNGIVYGETIFNPHSITVPPGLLLIGAPRKTNITACPSEQGGFVGLIDEVVIHAAPKSGRTICSHVIGATNCESDAIMDYPTKSQYRLRNQDPGCNSIDVIGSISCIRAFHAVCAQQTATDALLNSKSISNNQSLSERRNNLLGSRPLVSMVGVPFHLIHLTDGDEKKKGLTEDAVEVACAPKVHHSSAVEFSALEQLSDGCTNEQNINSKECLMASHRFCDNLGWSTGMIFQMTTRPWVSCFNSDRILQVSLMNDVLVSSSCAAVEEDGDYHWSASPGCLIAVSQVCQLHGYDAGIFQELLLSESNTVEIHCFQAATKLSLKI